MPHYLLDAVKLTVAFNIAARLYSSGVYADRSVFYQLKNNGLHRIIFSLFGTESDAHENVTGVAGSFEETLASITACHEVGLETEFHFVPLSHNYSILEDLACLAKENNIRRISVLRLVPQGRAKDSRLLTKDQNLHLRQVITQLRADGHDIRTGSPYNFLMLKDKPQCNSGIDRLTIGPDLRIFPCDAFKQLPPSDLGITSDYSSLACRTLAECWEKSPYLNFVREYLESDFAPECATCDCLEKCHSGCLAQKIHAHGAMVKAPDPMCLQQIRSF